MSRVLLAARTDAVKIWQRVLKDMDKPREPGYTREEVMTLFLALAFSLFCASAGLAEDAASARPPVTQIDDAPAPRLAELERALTKALQARQNGQMTPEAFGEFKTAFRVRLDAAMAALPPTSADASLHARILAQLDEYAPALASLEKTLAKDPDNAAVHKARSYVLLRQGDYPGALESAERILKQNAERGQPPDPEALAVKYSSQGRRARSAASARQAHALEAPQSHSVAVTSDDSRPAVLAVKGVRAAPGLVPAPDVAASSETPSERKNTGKGIGLLGVMGISAGLLMIAWAAAPQETKDRIAQEFWEQPRKELKLLAGAALVAGSVYYAAPYAPTVLKALAPGAPTAAGLTPALAGGGTMGRGAAIPLQRVAEDVAATGIVAKGLVALKKGWDHVSFAKSENDVGAPQGGSDAYTTAKNGGAHSGTFKNYAGRSTAEIQKAERSHLRQVELHRRKIQNPSQFAEEWGQMSPRDRIGLLKKWQRDISRNRELADIMRGLLKERGL